MASGPRGSGLPACLQKAQQILLTGSLQGNPYTGLLQPSAAQLPAAQGCGTCLTQKWRHKPHLGDQLSK